MGRETAEGVELDEEMEATVGEKEKKRSLNVANGQSGW